MLHMGAASGLIMNWSANINDVVNNRSSSSSSTSVPVRPPNSKYCTIFRSHRPSATASSSQDLTWSHEAVDVAPPHWMCMMSTTTININTNTKNIKASSVNLLQETASSIDKAAFCCGLLFHHIFSNTTPSLLPSIMLLASWRDVLRAADAMINRSTLLPDPEKEEDHYRLRPDYVRTELTYQAALEEEPYNTLYLSNYAQFLYVVAKDHHRADHYFRRAVEAETDAAAECLSRYADFLWLANNDFSAAEETYLKALSTDPGNIFLAAKYAHFLWSTGGEDTCMLPPQPML